MTDYKANAMRWLAEFKAMAAEHCKTAPEVLVTWNLKGTMAGTCGWKRGAPIQIRLNAVVAAAEGEAYRQTVGHEYAHAVQFALQERDAAAGISRRGLRPSWYQAHGGQWQAVMRTFGLEVRRCHSYASAKPVRNMRPHKFTCGCAGKVHAITTRRYEVHAAYKVAHGRSCFRCSVCAQSIVYVGREA